ncbi:MAG TPA: ribosome maturation factor RimM [Ktedonobacterales bacterium]|nr:ribosome maturation factor RimM [Ktedonobacterales bacterium]
MTDHSLRTWRAAPDPDWLLVGEVVGVFGVHGELKVRPTTDFPERFLKTPTLYVGARHVAMAVTAARVLPKQVLLTLEGVSDPTAAGKYRGALLYVPLSEAVALPPNQYFLHDVIGLRVERPDGALLGTISDIYTGPGNDVYVVREAGSGREVLVPAVAQMIKRVDVAAGVVVVDPIPGLFDDRFESADDQGAPEGEGQ